MGLIKVKNKFALKCFSGKIGASRTHPASLMENSINFFFETVPKWNFLPLTIFDDRQTSKVSECIYSLMQIISPNVVFHKLSFQISMF